jgi:hypothetical protein
MCWITMLCFDRSNYRYQNLFWAYVESFAEGATQSARQTGIILFLGTIGQFKKRVHQFNDNLLIAHAFSDGNFVNFGGIFCREVGDRKVCSHNLCWPCFTT